MKLREFRVELGWTQAQLASESGVSQTYISEIELGKKQPTITIAKKLAKAMDVSVSDLLEEDDTAKSSDGKAIKIKLSAKLLNKARKRIIYKFYHKII